MKPSQEEYEKVAKLADTLARFLRQRSGSQTLEYQMTHLQRGVDSLIAEMGRG